MTKVLEKIVVNNILCYLSTALEHKGRDEIVLSCFAHFDESSVLEAKSLINLYAEVRELRKRNNVDLLSEINTRKTLPVN